MVSKRDPTREDNPTGTVTRVTGHSITLAFDAKPPGWVFDSGVRLDLYVNDVTFQRMQDALETLPDATGALAHLRDVVVGVDDPDDDAPADVRDWHDEDLNDAQRAAVRRALGTEDVHLIHGPPGTGKTTTAVEVIRQAVDRGEAVLATAPSNTAVDNVLERLVAGGVDAVRVGHPARVTPTLREHTLDARVEEREAYQRAQEKREAAFELRDEQEALTAPSGRWRRGLSDSRIRDLAEKGQGARGVSAEKIAEMAEWLDYRERADALFEEAERLEDEAVAEVVASADVVCTTNATAGSDLLAGHEFDTLVLDEATQATEPGCLVPLVRADRAILAGDHRQLPPTIQSREAAEAGLRETLFERLAERHDGVVSLLDVQYRMHDAIAGFSSRCFYDGELTAPDAVATHTLADLLDADALPDARRPALAPEVPLAFVNTADIEAPERRREGSTSVENPTEADLVARLAEEYIAAGVAPADVAVISPYDDQVERLRGTLDYDGLEVDTVDGFQGREKEVVLVSLVRSNDEGRVGFLDEARRFNVALTRAKRKAVVVGDAETVTTADHYDAFRRYVRDREGAREVDAAALT